MLFGTDHCPLWMWKAECAQKAQPSAARNAPPAAAAMNTRPAGAGRRVCFDFLTSPDVSVMMVDRFSATPVDGHECPGDCTGGLADIDHTDDLCVRE